MSWFDDLEAKLEEYGKYIDPNGKIRDLIDTGASPLKVANLMREGFQEEGISGALGNFTELAGVPKKALVDIPVHEVSNLLVGEQGDIEPASEVLTEAISPDRDISGDTPPIFEGAYSWANKPTELESVKVEQALREASPDPEIEKQMKDIEDIISHTERGVIRAGANLIDPLIPLMAVGGPTGIAAGSAFVPEMAKGGGEELGTAIALGADQDDIGGAIEHGIGGATSLGMAGLAGVHTGKGIAKEVSPLVPEVMNKPVVWEAPREPVPITKLEIPNPNPDVIISSADRIVNTKAKSTSKERTPEDDYWDEVLGVEPDKPVTPFNESVTEANPYFEVKPLLEKALEFSPFEYDPTRLGMGFGGIKGKGPKDPYEGPYANIEKEIEGIEGIDPETPLETLPKVKSIPNIPKGETDIRTAINERAKEIQSLVVGIDPVKAKKLAMLDIAREEATKKAIPPEESTKVEKEPPIPPEEVSEIEPLGEEGRPRPYTVTLSDNSRHTIKAKSAEEAGSIAKDILQQRGNVRKLEVFSVEEKLSSLEKAGAGEIATERADKVKLAEQKKLEGAISKEKIKAAKSDKPKKESFDVVLEDGSKHRIRGTSPESVTSYIESKGLKVKTIEKHLSSLERAAQGKMESEVNPSESSLVDDITDLPKTLKSSFDISFPLRQGLFLLNRATGRGAIARGTKSGLSEKNHLEIQKDLSERSNAPLYKEFGLNQVKYDPTEANSLSEQHPLFKTNPSKFSKEIQKIPGLKQSERMFTDSGNLMRADTFDFFHKKWSAEGKTPESRPDLYHGLSKYLNVLTGRDPLPTKLQQASHILNKLFWSPQYVKSRLQILNPVFYARLPREVQLEAIRDVGGTLGTLTVLLSAVNYAAKQAGMEDEVHVEWNPTHTDFGKLKVGKTKYDFFTGLVPIIRTASRIATSRKETAKGEYQISGGFGLGSELFEPKTEYLPLAPFGQSGFGELGQFAEGKTAPAYQISKGLLSGKDYFGGEYGVPDFLSDAMAPMAAADIISAWRNHDAKEGLKAIPSILGVGVQTDRVKDETFKWGKSKKRKKKSSRELLLF